MERTCVQCGKPFQAQRVTAKYCGSTCRAAASLAAPNVVTMPSPDVQSSDSGEAPVVRLHREELVAVGRLETAQGAIVMELARAMADANPGSPSKAQIAKQLQAAYDVAMKGTRIEETRVDELRKKRDELRRKSS